MSRNEKTRRKARKERRRKERSEEAICRAEGRLPSWFDSGKVETRDPRTRWSNLRTAREGYSIAMAPTGIVVPVDFAADNPVGQALAGLSKPVDE